jgi:formylglycine-generating enzyme required for sulfatase activity
MRHPAMWRNFANRRLEFRVHAGLCAGAGLKPQNPSQDGTLKARFRQPLIIVLLFCLAGCAGSNGTQRREAPPVARIGNSSPPAGMVFIRGGTFQMGAAGGMPNETPAREVWVKSFWIDKYEVTVAEFARFVKATGYRTDAEKFGWSGVFDVGAAEWTRADGATWRNPDGGAKQAAPDEPVTQVSWRDAAAYANWAGKRLPTEAEWEFAARGGLAQNEYAWGNELRPGGKPSANWWQGAFPAANTAEDGYLRRAPVGRFAPNGYGLYDVAGNVWEWTQDWYAEDFYSWGRADNPSGPAAGEERAIRGGSWMCAENFCSNYRVAARSHATPDSGMNNLGFRLVRDE